MVLLVLVIGEVVDFIWLMLFVMIEIVVCIELDVLVVLVDFL